MPPPFGDYELSRAFFHFVEKPVAFPIFSVWKSEAVKDTNRRVTSSTLSFGVFSVDLKTYKLPCEHHVIIYDCREQKEKVRQ